MTTDISVSVRWDPATQQEVIDDYDYDGGNSSSRLFERSRIKALAGKYQPSSQPAHEVVVGGDGTEREKSPFSLLFYPAQILLRLESVCTVRTRRVISDTHETLSLPTPARSLGLSSLRRKAEGHTHGKMSVLCSVG